MNRETSSARWEPVGKATKTAQLIGLEMPLADLTLAHQLTTVRLAEPLRSALRDLGDTSGKNHWRKDVHYLRVVLAHLFPELIDVTPLLGVGDNRSGSHPGDALVFAGLVPQDLSRLPAGLVEAFSVWVTDVLELGLSPKQVPLVERLRDQVIDSNFELDTVMLDGMYGHRLGFASLAQAIGKRLSGTELFQGLGPCFQVSPVRVQENKVVLATRPAPLAEGAWYSMFAEIFVVTMPCNPDRFFLAIKPIKRVWAKGAPKVRYSSPAKFHAYVLRPDKPAIQVPVIKSSDQWAIDAAYNYLWRMSAGTLPATLSELGDQAVGTGWWLGIPELTVLYSSVSPRSTLERDETDLLNAVRRELGDFLGSPLMDIACRDVNIAAMTAAAKKKMITPDAETDAMDFGRQYRETLETLYPGKQVKLLMIGGSPTEFILVSGLVRQLFGDKVLLQQEVVPYQAHGLKQTLPLPDETGRKRFDARVKAWAAIADMIRAQTDPVAVIVCTPDVIDASSEDHVNKPAARHALSAAGANVQYLLPLSGKDPAKSRKGFAYRAENALLDVLFAHAGAVVGPTLDKILDPIKKSPMKPNGVYGISVIRANSKRRMGQKGAQFIFYTRLDLESGKTYARFVHQAGARRTKLTEWAPMSQALTWIGAQLPRENQMTADWLSREFTQYTKTVLAEIEKTDPYAIVQIEWDSIGGLWGALRDENLNAGHPPMLGEAKLSALQGMTFIRIRRREDTLKLRTLVTTSYRPVSKDGSGSEVIETYPSTYARLVEVTSPIAAINQPRAAHFVATSGYPKTSQIIRGLSCFRTTSRMRKQAGSAKDGNAVFLLKESTPAGQDVGLPAGLDITVLQAPPGAPLAGYALITLALRKGHAHHDDWTALPIPLFYRAKAEDYVIRYASDEDEPDA